MEERIGHYSIVSELGRGGMGVVYKAHEESLNRFVALKVLGQHLSEDESYVERFKREAQSAAALNHPNIVQIYSIDDFDGRHCFAMEYVQGTSIQQMIKSQGPMDPAAAARLILQAAAGLGAAHSHGIIHRDIKPANLMVDERGLVKITDFGLALLAEGATRLTATGMFMGTPGYLSPEQCLDEDVDHRADIYSLGVTLYEMLTGITPFKADSPLALLRQIIDVEPKDVGELRPEVPEALQSILKKMMTKKREERYADCDILTADLQSWLETTGGAGSDLSAVVAAVVGGGAGAAGAEASASLKDLNTDPTLRVDSKQLPGSQPPPPPLPEIPVTAPVEPDETEEPEMVAAPVTEAPSSNGNSRLALGLAIAAVVAVALLTVTGYAAWRFGAIDGLMAMITGPIADTDAPAQASIDPSTT
ncbi:MAG: serine/threonine-protein kinase, partial [Acidobacteriota bacterium]